jgi:hypothetical protein
MIWKLDQKNWRDPIPTDLIDFHQAALSLPFSAAGARRAGPSGDG